MNVEAIKAAWAEWDDASRATDIAHMAWKDYQRAYTGPRFKALRAEAKARWEATLDRTDAARKAVAGLPDPGEVEAYEREQAAIAAERAAQGSLF